MEKISVVVLLNSYNTNINKCLKSLVNQTLNSFEIVCLGANLTNNVNVALEKYKHKNPIRLIELSNEEITNDIFNKINGEFIYFIEVHQNIKDFTLEMLYLNAKINDLDMIYFDQRNYNINHEKTFKGTEFFEKISVNSNFHNNLALQLIKKDFLVKNNILIKNKMITQQLISTASRIRYLKFNLNETIIEKTVNNENVNSKNIELEEIKKLCEQNKKDIIKKDQQILSLVKDAESYKKEIAMKDEQILSSKKSVELYKKNVNKYKGQLNYHKKEKESIKNSISFKIGRIITYIPRKIKNIFKK